MVFSSVPVYIDPPNWQQQQQEGNQQRQQQATQVNYSSSSSARLIPVPPGGGAPGRSTSGGGVGPTGSSLLRPGSMADRARMAKVPLPEAGLKCPRCESTNTKFCYFNNYSLSQPRHFCKSCRRYWTRGGALRNVPVGGGCRRNNKRGRGANRSKSPVMGDWRGGVGGGGGGAVVTGCSTSGLTNSTLNSSHLPCPLPPQLPFMLGNYIPGSEVGLHLGGLRGVSAIAGGGGVQQGGSSAGRSSSSLAGLSDQTPPSLRLSAAMQQFPFLTGLEPPAPPLSLHPPPSVELYGFQSAMDGMEDSGVKLVDNEGLNLSRNLLGIHHRHRHHHDDNGEDDHYNWSTGNAWPDLL
ncbi:hypothetical protein Dimus_011348 [Dionaea muscipula]